jgi:sigma-B regulation protein RsbU (phosphoserine phosphatase)
LRNGIIHGLDGKGGVPLGLFPDSNYGEATEKLQTGDLLMLYTDGIIEARSRDGELMGVERLDTAIKKGPFNAQSTLDRILTTLDTFTGGATPLDDQTLLAAAIK